MQKFDLFPHTYVGHCPQCSWYQKLKVKRKSLKNVKLEVLCDVVSVHSNFFVIWSLSVRIRCHRRWNRIMLWWKWWLKRWNNWPVTGINVLSLRTIIENMLPSLVRDFHVLSKVMLVLIDVGELWLQVSL